MWSDDSHKHRSKSHTDDSRQCETSAFIQLRREARALCSRTYRDFLTPLERELHDLDRRLLTSGRHPALRNQLDRATYIAGRYSHLHMGPRQINAILDEVKVIMRDAAALEEYEESEEHQAKMAVRETLEELRTPSELTRMIR